MPELEEDMNTNFVNLAKMAIEYKVEYLVIAGDMFESNNYVKPHTIAFITNTVEELKKHGIQTVGIAGDHDKPLKGEAWVHISQISPVTVEPCFAGIDYFDYSTVSVEELVERLKEHTEPENVLWLFLHCQFPQLFEKTDRKKMIDYNQLRLFDNFPNIQGVIAGDLHFAPEIKAYGPGKEAYVGYPGSLGINDKSEFKHKKHVLYCDGKSLFQVPFPVLRTSLEIDFRGDLANNFDVEETLKWAKDQTNKPLIYVYYDTDSEGQIHKITPLYNCALVHRQQVPLGVKNLDDAQIITSRSETSADEKINSALAYYCKDDPELFGLAAALIKNDTNEILTEFKDKFDL